jgi:hypothetical protein
MSAFRLLTTIPWKGVGHRGVDCRFLQTMTGSIVRENLNPTAFAVHRTSFSTNDWDSTFNKPFRPMRREVNDDHLYDYEIGLPNKLYVGQLAWSVNWQQLKDHFKQCGRVTRANVSMDRDDKTRSNGFGFVEFERAEDAERAIQELNNSMLEGRMIHVRADRKRVLKEYPNTFTRNDKY